MVANPARRQALTDAALELLGREGARAVTHRAVDAAAGLPAGTCVNYFPSRAVLLAGMAERIFALLQPDPGRLESLAELPVTEAAPEYVGYVVERLLVRPHLARALIELRLEAARTPAVADPLTVLLRAGLDADVAFHEARGLPGGREAVVLLHHVVEGILLDAVTVPLEGRADPVEAARSATPALLAGTAVPRR